MDKSIERPNGYTAKVVATITAILVAIGVGIWTNSTVTISPKQAAETVQYQEANNVLHMDREYVRRSEMQQFEKRLDRLDDKLDRVIELQIKQNGGK